MKKVERGVLHPNDAGWLSHDATDVSLPETLTTIGRGAPCRASAGTTGRAQVRPGLRNAARLRRPKRHPQWAAGPEQIVHRDGRIGEHWRQVKHLSTETYPRTLSSVMPGSACAIPRWGSGSPRGTARLFLSILSRLACGGLFDARSRS